MICLLFVSILIKKYLDFFFQIILLITVSVSLCAAILSD